MTALEGMKMIATTFNTADATREQSGSALLAILGAAAIGLSILFATGNVQASVMHDAAHDMRHATGFPCH
jgi:cobalt transporter subunit CbtB